MIKDINVSIVIHYSNELFSDSIFNALSPDDFVGESLVVKTQKKGTKITITIKSQRSLGSIIRTLDDILRTLSVAEKQLKILANKK